MSISNTLGSAYLYNEGTIINSSLGDIELMKHIRIKKGERSEKGYYYKCLTCENEDSISECHIKRGDGCNVCSSHKVLKGYNDIHTTNPQLFTLLKNKSDGYLYMEKSSKVLEWICPNCGSISNQIVVNVNKRGISCSKCGDGISYPEKFLFNVLEQLGIDFTPQLSKTTFDWCNNYKYDVYIPSINGILEIQGKQHYNGGFECCGGRTLVQEQENDKLKESLAIKNGINIYISIDCRESELEFIKNSIFKSDMSKLFNLESIDWNKCHQFSCNTIIKTICKLWNDDVHAMNTITSSLKIGRAKAINCLKKGAILGWCTYNPKEEMKKNGVNNSAKSCKQVKCITTNKIFKSIRIAAEQTGIDKSYLSTFLNGKRVFAGKHPETGKPLTWMFYEDYLNIPQQIHNNA